MPVASDLVCLIAFEMDAAGDRTRPGASGQRAAVRRSAEGPSAPCPTPSTLVRPVVATALPAGGPHAAGRPPPFLAAASGAVSNPVLARVYDAAVVDRPDSRPRGGC